MAETKGNVLKVRLGNDTRRQLLYNTNISYNDLVLMLQRIFPEKLQPSDDVTLKYFDEDDDLITIVDDSDFAHAREYSQTGIVKMIVYVNGKDNRTSVDGSIVRRELGILRDRVNTIIDTLDTQTSGMTLESKIETSRTSEIVEVVEPVRPVSTETISIFDPYKPSPAITTVSSSNLTETTSALPIQPSVSTSTDTTVSSSNTSHLFQGQSDSSFLDHTQTSQVPTQQTGQTGIPQTGIPQTGVPQTGQQLQSQANPTAPPSSSSPKPPQPTGYSNYPSSQGTAYQGSSSYATGQANFPTSQQSSYQTSQSGYPGSQTGQMNYQSPQTNYGGGYGTSYPNQSSAPAPPAPVASTSTHYQPSSMPNPGTYPPSSIPNQGTYPSSSYASGPGTANYVPPSGYNQPQVQYGSGQNPPTGPAAYSMSGGAGRGRVTAYGQTPYKVGY